MKLNEDATARPRGVTDVWLQLGRMLDEDLPVPDLAALAACSARDLSDLFSMRARRGDSCLVS